MMSLKEMCILDDVVSLFLSDGAFRLETLRDAITADRSEEIQNSAHSLRGSALNLGATHLAKLLRTVEEAARQGDTATASKHINSITEEFDRVSQALRLWTGSDADTTSVMHSGDRSARQK
jgi:HPt (histidine-containing phosphotransfer) domain-containing protein